MRWQLVRVTSKANVTSNAVVYARVKRDPRFDNHRIVKYCLSLFLSLILTSSQRSYFRRIEPVEYNLMLLGEKRFFHVFSNIKSRIFPVDLIN